MKRQMRKVGRCVATAQARRSGAVSGVLWSLVLECSHVEYRPGILKRDPQAYRVAEGGQGVVLPVELEPAPRFVACRVCMYAEANEAAAKKRAASDQAAAERAEVRS